MIVNTISTLDTKTVFDKRGITIVRERGYGFRCNGISTSWCVYSGDKPAGSYSTLKRAKVWAEYLARVVV